VNRLHFVALCDDPAQDSLDLRIDGALLEPDRDLLRAHVRKGVGGLAGAFFLDDELGGNAGCGLHAKAMLARGRLGGGGCLDERPFGVERWLDQNDAARVVLVAHGVVVFSELHIPSKYSLADGDS
jgi:hypothetical protein